MVSIGVSNCISTTSALSSSTVASLISLWSSFILAPDATDIQFSPFESTKINAIPVDSA